jgi:hypothetical protein
MIYNVTQENIVFLLSMSTKQKEKPLKYFSKIIDAGAIAAIVYFLFGIKSMKITDPSICSCLLAIFIITSIHWAYPFWKNIIAKWKQVIFAIFWFFIAFFFIAIITQHIWKVYQKPEDIESGAKKDLLIPGILLSDSFKDLSGIIYFHCGSFYQSFKLSQLVNGVNYSPNVFVCEIGKITEKPITINFKIIYDKLVISSIIKDIEHGEEIAEIKDNQISIIKPYVLDWNISPNNKKFEVIDKENNVVLKVSLLTPNVIDIQGYFINNHTISVINDTGMLTCYHMDDPKEKEVALDAINKIKRID